MPRKRRHDKKRHRELLMEEHVELVIGPKRNGSVFASAAARRACWVAHREEILAADNPGLRPMAWWEFESPEPRDPGEHETAQLIRLGLLTDDERAALEKHAWPVYERQARQIAWVHGGTAGEAMEIEAYYTERRRHGIPDEWSAPPRAGEEDPFTDEDQDPDPDEDAAPWG